MKSLIEPYNTNWKTEFEQLRARLHDIPDCFETDIQHVGSTAIPGLCAKPILDIDIIIDNRSMLPDIAKKLENVGYLNRGDQGIPGRFAFRQSSRHTPESLNRKTWQEHHLYVCFSDSLALKNHLLFRDALLNDQNLVNEYARLKFKLASEKTMTREKYTRLKTDFILSVLTNFRLDQKDISEIRQANLNA